MFVFMDTGEAFVIVTDPGIADLLKLCVINLDIQILVELSHKANCTSILNYVCSIGPIPLRHQLNISGFPTARLPIWFDRILCAGNESSLLDCSHNGIGEIHSLCAEHQYDVGVSCLGEINFMNMMLNS